MNGQVRQTMVEGTTIVGNTLTKRYATDGETFFDMTWQGSPATGWNTVTGLGMYYADSGRTETVRLDVNLSVLPTLDVKEAVTTLPVNESTNGGTV